MSALATIILPVFLVLGFGYVARWRGLVTDDHVEGMMKFAQGFAIPCLLFRAISTLDLGAEFEVPLLASFYFGAGACFAIGIAGARWLFGRPWEDAVAIGFVGLYSNSLLLGLPITERAYGPDALTANYAIVAFHAPFCYLVGITAMETVRARGTALRHLPGKVAGAMFHNALVIGIGLGVAVNVTGVPVPGVLSDAIDLMVSAALPTALFALGGVLYRYRPEGDLRTIGFVVAISLLVHPALVWMMGGLTGLDRDGLRSAVITASVAPGINAYLFANMYGAARRVAASAVLVGTAATILSSAFWITVLP